jgi:hypothetical protein
MLHVWWRGLATALAVVLLPLATPAGPVPEGAVRAVTGATDATSVPYDPPGPGEELVSARAAAARERRWQERTAALTATLAAYQRSVGLTFGVGLVNHATGQVYRYGAEQTFETASVVKVQIAATLLLQRQDAGRPPGDAERSQLAAMIRSSDNEAASALLERVGGAAAVNRAAARFGLTATAARPVWGQTTTRIDDQLRLLAALRGDGPLTPAATTYLLDLMGHVRTDQAWGVSAGAPGQAVPLKNGWIPRTSLGGRWVVNSVGILPGVTVVVLTRGARTQAAGVAAIEAVTTTALDTLAWH